MTSTLPDASELELEIAIAKQNYNSSYEKLRIEKWRQRIYYVVVILGLTTYLVARVSFFDLIQSYVPSVTPEQLESYTVVVLIGSIALAILLGFSIIRDKPWPYIYVHYNRAAVAAADRAGKPLLPPELTQEEMEQRQRKNDFEVARTATFSFGDYALLAAGVTAVLELAFSSAHIPTWTAFVVIFCSKFRLMFFGMARFGVWAGIGFYLAATVFFIGILLIADGNFSRWYLS